MYSYSMLVNRAVSQIYHPKFISLNPPRSITYLIGGLAQDCLYFHYHGYKSTHWRPYTCDNLRQASTSIFLIVIDAVESTFFSVSNFCHISNNDFLSSQRLAQVRLFIEINS